MIGNLVYSIVGKQPMSRLISRSFTDLMDEKTVEERFGLRFKEACELSGLSKFTQIKLGKLIGVSGPVVNHYRNGKQIPSISTAIRICELTGVSLDWLILGRGEAGESIPALRKSINQKNKTTVPVQDPPHLSSIEALTATMSDVEKIIVLDRLAKTLSAESRVTLAKLTFDLALSPSLDSRGK